MPRVYPPPLRSGDNVAIVCPASTPAREPVERAVGRLLAMGLNTKTYGNLYRSRGYLAGSDDQRADELMQALADPEVRAVLPARGGYGISRLLDRLDYSIIDRLPKILTGFSDLTALHLAVQAKTNLITFHSPNLQDGLGAPDSLDPLSLETYRSALLAQDSASYELVSNAKLVALGLSPMTRLVGGRAQGALIGGNVSVLTALTGSQYEVQTDDCILLLEDVGEQPYRLDRYLSQLRLAGKFRGLAGVLLGHFSKCQSDAGKPSLELSAIMSDYFCGLGIPVLNGFPCGHEKPNITLPIGGIVELDADQAVVRVIKEGRAGGECRPFQAS